MDDAPTTPPAWGADQNSAQSDVPPVALPATDPVSVPAQAQSPEPATVPEPAALPADAPAAGAPTVSDALAAYQEALEMRVAAQIKDLCGEAAVEEYVALRTKDDLAEILIFEATQGINIERLFREQDAAMRAEMEQKMPGSTSFLTDNNSAQ